MVLSMSVSALVTSPQVHCRAPLPAGGGQGSGPTAHQSDSAVPHPVPGQVWRPCAQWHHSGMFPWWHFGDSSMIPCSFSFWSHSGWMTVGWMLKKKNWCTLKMNNFSRFVPPKQEERKHNEKWESIWQGRWAVLCVPLLFGAANSSSVFIHWLSLWLHFPSVELVSTDSILTLLESVCVSRGGVCHHVLIR